MAADGGSAGAGLVAVLAFNWALVPPRRSFAIANLEHHAPLLLTLLALSWISAGLMARLRRQAEALRSTLQQLLPGAPVLLIGTPDADQHTGLRQSLRHSIAFGPGTQRH